MHLRQTNRLFKQISYLRNWLSKFLLSGPTLLIAERDSCIESLRPALHIPEVRRALAMRQKDGVYLREPSTLFPNHAAFDTEQQR
jgi:hypothetical protein